MADNEINFSMPALLEAGWVGTIRDYTTIDNLCEIDTLDKRISENINRLENGVTPVFNRFESLITSSEGRTVRNGMRLTSVSILGIGSINSDGSINMNPSITDAYFIFTGYGSEASGSFITDGEVYHHLRGKSYYLLDFNSQDQCYCLSHADQELIKTAIKHYTAGLDCDE